MIKLKPIRLWLSAIILNLCLASLVEADFRYYEAAIDRSVWELSANAIHCELSHTIPNYGKAVFSSRASRTPNLVFDLQVVRNLPQFDGQVTLRSQAPAWRVGVISKELGNFAIQSGRKPVSLQAASAWRVLTELEQGMFPTFYYEGWVDGRDAVSVGISSVNFLKIYEQFLICVSDLLPYSFEDIATMTINFDFDKHTFNKKAKSQLARVKAYLEAEPGLEFALVVGHTDSKGGRWYNKKLGEKRAQSVQDFLIAAGVKKENIKITSHGERKPIASNRTKSGRAMNRRVILKMEK